MTSDRAIEEPLLNRAPMDQPGTVHELAERLLSAYTVDDGTVRLAGCLLEDRLFMHVTARRAETSVEFFLDNRGQLVGEALIETLGMRETVELDRPPEQAEEAVRQLAVLGRRKMAERFAGQDPPDVIDVVAVWCKFAEGKLRFTIGENSIDVPFADWARVLEPPPFVCPHTGAATYHLSATDDGRIVAAEQIATCQESNQRVLAGELVTCAVTGRQVLPSFAETCPVTGDTVLRTQMVRCGVCQQEVAPAAMRKEYCAACERREPITKADPRLARVLDEHPRLERWRRWELSETSTVYCLVATGWFRRLLIVIDKETLELKLLATGTRFRNAWETVEPSQYEETLRG